jgi:hypothetical protein
MHELSWLTVISDAGSTPAASTSLRPLRGLRFGKPQQTTRLLDLHQTSEGCHAGASAQADISWNP